MVITFGMIIAKPDYKKQKSESVDLASDVVCLVLLHLEFGVCKDDHDVFGLKDGFGAWKQSRAYLLKQKSRSPIGNTNEAAENCSKNIPFYS